MMDDRGSKKILFNKSTLFSLKAELLRKQEEVKEKKHLPQHRVENHKPPTSKKDPENEPKKTFKDSLKAIDSEEIEACKKSKAILEKKAELYEHLADGAGSSELAGQFLVDFNTKKQQEARNQPVDDEEPDTYVSHEDDDDEWAEYTDCLGRTRICLKSDLHLYTKKDEELRREVLKDKPSATEHIEQLTDTTTSSTQEEMSFLAQKTQDYLHSLRAKWEQKERELQAKNKDVHYQDLLFDEARQHGVGYYSFSTDENERSRQMEELTRTREDTLRAQRDAEQARKQRDELMAARVAAARARQRQRAGLPPEEPKDNTKDFTSCLLEFLTKQKDEADANAKEKEMRIREEKEKERQKLREAYIREWDLGKDGVEGKPKKFVEMTQEEYVEQQRAKRIDEFAPQGSGDSHRSRYSFDEHGRKVYGELPHHKSTKTWAEVRPETGSYQQSDRIDYNDDVNEQKGLYFSTIKSTPDPGSNKYANFVKPQSSISSNERTLKTETVSSSEKKYITATRTTQEQDRHQSMKYKNFAEFQPEPEETNKQAPICIVNEVSDGDDDPIDEDSDNTRRVNSEGEIPPPPTYDYYGPVPKKSRHERPFTSDIHESFAQGSKSLEVKSAGRKISHQYDFSLE